MEQVAHAQLKSILVLQKCEILPLIDAAQAEVRLEEVAGLRDIGHLQVDMVDLHNASILADCGFAAPVRRITAWSSAARGETDP